MLQENQDYRKTVYNHLIDISNKSVMPPEHLIMLKKLRDEYNFYPNVCYDIGSSVLHWTQVVEQVWKTKIILFDAFQPAEFLYLKYDYNIGLLSDTDDKELKFYQNDFLPGGNSYYREKFENSKYFPEENHIIKKSNKLDTVVTNRKFPYPDLVKIDVQGSEMDVIKGGINVISHCKFLIVEMQHIEYNENAPLVGQTLPFIEQCGFKCISEKFCNNGADADYLFINKKFL